MLSRIVEKFGYKLVKADEHKDSVSVMLENFKLSEKNSRLAEELKAEHLRNQVLIDEVEGFRSQEEIIDPFLGDPSPKDLEKRRAYVGAVAGLHKDILEPKLKQMIAAAYVMLEDASNDREFDQSVKGTIYALREILRWGQSMVNEQLSFQTRDIDN